MDKDAGDGPANGGEHFAWMFHDLLDVVIDVSVGHRWMMVRSLLYISSRWASSSRGSRCGRAGAALLSAVIDVVHGDGQV